MATKQVNNMQTPSARKIVGVRLVEVAKKLVITGFLALVKPGTLLQLYLAVGTGEVTRTEEAGGGGGRGGRAVSRADAETRSQVRGGLRQAV